MTNIKRLTAVPALLGLSLAAAAAPAQDVGRPDLKGVWTNASRTLLSRPQGIDRLVVSAEEESRVIIGCIPMMK